MCEKFIKLKNYKIFYEDFDSTLFQLEEIFNNEIYNISLKKKNPVIFDVGANIGLATLYFKLKYPNAIIHAFEPNLYSFRLLEKNVKFNKIVGITLNNFALSDYKGKLDLYYHDSNTSPTTSIYNTRGGSNTLLAKCEYLSSYISYNIDLLKLDVEGSEYYILNDIVRSNKINKINNLIIEYHHHLVKDNDNLSLFLSLLEENNFGYQIKADLNLPYKRKRFQDILIFAYKK